MNDQDEVQRDNRAGSLLINRGWTLQEEAQSSRFLSFQPQQTSLCIGDKVYHEDGFIDDISKRGYLNLGNSNFTSWRQVVVDYSKRELTVETDKLPAISGLAQRYLHNKQRSDDVYLAGFWRSSLQNDLCWYVLRYTTNQSSNPRRPIKYRAPSWSWAAVDAPVDFTDSSHQITLEFLHTSIQIAGRDPLGQVSGGSLLLRAKIGEQLWIRQTFGSDAWYYAHPLHESVPSEVLSASVPYSKATLRLDVSEALSVTELRIWSLPKSLGFALALQRNLNIEDAFTRIGCIIDTSPSTDDDYMQM